MNTRPDEQLPYQDLAGQGARVVRSVQADGLVRLAELAPGRGTMHVDMAFSRGSDGRPRVSGTAELAVDATCQRCLEVLERPLRVSFDLCIVQDPMIASELAHELDVLVADSDMVTIAEVIEDELILELPERLCIEEPCPYEPASQFPARTGNADSETGASEPGEGEAEREDNPFRVLMKLKE